MKEKEIQGIIDMSKNGHAYLITDNKLGKDFFINKNKLNQALNGDTVIVEVLGSDNKAEVKEVVKRATDHFSGVIDIKKGKKNHAFVRTSGNKMMVDIFVAIEDIGEVENGDVVVVKMKEWRKDEKSPRGIVVKSLGKPNTFGSEMGIIMNKHNIDYSFPQEVLDEAELISEVISEKEIAKRKDMRETLSFSIDGADAKDLDDVLSFKVLDNGNYEVGVHIADIGYFVKKGGKIDSEALSRGTSVYLTSKCVPMLPEKLSNNLASLNPGTDKLTVSVIFEITPEGEIKNHTFEKTIINSNFRFTYDGVQSIIEFHNNNQDNNLKVEEHAIVVLDKIAKKIRNKRFEDGSVHFNSKESKFILDENNVPIDVYFNELKCANQLIEEYMLLANRFVGTFLYKNNIPAAFRVHDSPDVDRLNELSIFVKNFGYELIISGDVQNIKKSLNKLLIDISDTPEENMISTLAVRCMVKAICSPTNIGHYGLGEDFMPPNAYSWFTSGIRRYADIINQRQLFDSSNYKNPAELEDICKHISEQEKKAQKAERESTKYMQCVFLNSKIGTEFKAIISGVKSWGIYVEIIENGCESMISSSWLKSQGLMVDEEKYCIKDTVRGGQYRLGDEINIQISKVDVEKKEIDSIILL